jgi:hypothetical protein
MSRFRIKEVITKSATSDDIPFGKTVSDAATMSDIPLGVELERVPEFRALPLASQEAVRAGKFSLDEAWKAHAFDREDAHSIPYTKEEQRIIRDALMRVMNQNTTSSAIYHDLLKRKKIKLLQAFALHYFKHKKFDFESKTVANAYLYVDTINQENGGELLKTYNLEQLEERAEQVIAFEKKKGVARKYANDLYALTFNQPFGKEYAPESYVAEILYRTFRDTATSKWHRAVMREKQIKETQKQLMLDKIKEYIAGVNAHRTKPDPTLNGEINESLLSRLNPEQPPTRIGSEFEIEGTKYDIEELHNRKDLILESSKMKHCVGDSSTYYNKIREGKGRIFSIRDSAGEPLCTIEYGVSAKSILQCKFYGNTALHESDFNEMFVCEVLSQLYLQGIEVHTFEDIIGFSVVQTEKGFSASYSHGSLELIIKDLASENIIAILGLATHKISRETSEKMFKQMTSIYGVTLNTTEASLLLKTKLESVRGSLFDSSDDAYPLLKRVEGDVSVNTSELPALEYVGGKCTTQSSRSQSIKSLRHVERSLSLPWMSESTHLTNLSYIGGRALLQTLRNVTGLENLTHIGEGIYAPQVLTEDLQRIPALRRK